MMLCTSNTIISRLPKQWDHSNRSIGWLTGWLAASLTASPCASVYQWSEVLSERARGRTLRGRPRAPHPCLAGCLNGWAAGSLTSCEARLLAGWLNDGEADWRAGWLCSWSGNDLEVLSGRAGPRPAGAAPRAHACLAGVWLLAGLLVGWALPVEAKMALGRSCQKVMDL